ncbi:type II secretion system protein [Thalassotalea psychrophila]|uniref:Type II secretion system protein n=1 Tax=Thalassotalea psychrophila TaxID=3065647 RepID=A0ABY9TVZ6_9GAMM|nr:type II secretion system protein [Colwelliaceae bacterium SQ149]
MNNNKGFTLIELVIVIVILGILAATAAPKFLDLTGDARTSVMKGVQGSVNSAADIVHAKALITGQTADNDSTTYLEGTSISIDNGWPTADAAGIGSAIDLSTDSGVSQSAAGSTWVFTHEDATETCEVIYGEPQNVQDRPVVTSDLDNC